MLTQADAMKIPRFLLLLGTALAVVFLPAAAQSTAPDEESPAVSTAVREEPCPPAETRADPLNTAGMGTLPLGSLPEAMASALGILPSEALSMRLLFQIVIQIENGFPAADVAVWSKGQTVPDPE